MFTIFELWGHKPFLKLVFDTFKLNNYMTLTHTLLILLSSCNHDADNYAHNTRCSFDKYLYCKSRLILTVELLQYFTWPMKNSTLPLIRYCAYSHTHRCNRLANRSWHISPTQNGRHFADDIFKCIFGNAMCFILIAFPLKFSPKVKTYNNPVFVQIMSWRRLPGAKPLSEPMMVIWYMYICVTRPQ